MGLDINSIDYGGYRVADYERVGSYGYIHVLRKWVLERLEGNSKEEIDNFYNYFSESRREVNIKVEKYPALLDHSDAEGGYISFKAFGIIGTKNPVQWADLDKLRTELRQLKKHTKEMDEYTLGVYKHIDKLINMKGENGEKAVIIFFR